MRRILCVLTEAPAPAGVDPPRRDLSPLRYPGGKRRMSPFIATLFRLSGASAIMEPFAGGASVSLTLVENGLAAEAAIADADPLVAAFWSTVFSTEAALLAEMVSEAVLDVSEWRRQKALSPRSRLESAYKLLYLNRTSFSGSLKSNTGPLGGMAGAATGLIASRFNREALACRIVAISALRDRVMWVRCGDWRETVAQASGFGRKPFIYLDPPYFAKSGRLYPRHFNDADHRDLASYVMGDPGAPWALSYDRHPDAEAAYGAHPGYAVVGMVHTAGRRAVRDEIVVSDVIGKARRTGALPRSGRYSLPVRREDWVRFDEVMPAVA